MSDANNPVPSPWWKSIEDKYNQNKDVQIPMAPQEEAIPEQAIAPEIPAAPIQAPTAPRALVSAPQDDTVNLSGPIEQGVVESGKAQFNPDTGGLEDITSPSSDNKDAGKTTQETLLEEFRRMQGEDQKRLADARSSDRKLKIGGAIGDSLATLLNARGQMNVKAPGVGVKEGAGLSKIADMFQTAPQASEDMKTRREDLIAQYRAMGGGNEDLKAHRDRMYDLAVAGQDLRKQKELGINSRHGENLGFRGKVQDYREVEGNELKPKEAETLYGIDKTLDEVNKLAEMKTFSTGPIEGRVQKVLAYIGKNPANKEALVAQLGAVLSSYAKQMSGTAVGEEEFSRLRAQLPSVNEPDDVFAGKIARFKEQIEDARYRFVDHYQSAGRNLTTLSKRKELKDIRSSQNESTKGLQPSEPDKKEDKKDPEIKKLADLNFNGDYEKASRFAKRSK